MFEFIKKWFFGTSVALSPFIEDPSLAENKMDKTVTFLMVNEENGVEILSDTQDNFTSEDRIFLTRVFDVLKAKDSPFTLLDIGAGVGSVCLLAKYFPSSKWYAIEPVKGKLDLLKKNIGLNHLFMVDCFEKAILDQNDKFTYQVEVESHEKGYPGDSCEHVKEVDAISVDLFCREQGLEHVDFLKIRAANNEWRILQGAKECIMRDRPVIFMDLSRLTLRKNGSKLKEIKKFLKECKYKTRNIGVKKWMCTPLEQLSLSDGQEKISKESAV